MVGSGDSLGERELRRAMRDLVALSTLPALWAGYDAESIAGSLGDVLLKILGLDFVFVKVRQGEREPVSLCRAAAGGSDAEARGLLEEMTPWIDGAAAEPPPELHHPGDGAPLRPALARFGHSGDHGLVVAASRREGFPGEADRLLLGVGANHAATVLQRRRIEEALRRQNRSLDTLIRFSSELAGERDLQSVVQTAVDAGRELTGAGFGAFFFNEVGSEGETYMLYALSGARREEFAGFPMPRNTALFGPTFRGEGTVRIDDVRRDPRYGTVPPHHGLPPGHLPVRSYLATSVVSRSGDVLGGLFFGHPRAGVFRPESERIVEGLAAHAAIAIDNARLYESLNEELAERQAAERALREAAERKDEFLAMLGHELRNPLAPIRNGLEILERTGRDPERHGHALKVMRRQLAHLTRLVDDLLDVSRISRGKIELRRERLDAARLVRETVEDHRPAMAEADLGLELDVPEEPVWLEGDRVRLAQSLGNLLENACKFTDPGGRVTVTLRSGDGAAVVTVADDGVGIAAEDLPHVLEVFSQSRFAGDRNRAGLGLGLAVVRSLVELHGGTVKVSSDGPGRGTEVELHLPLLGDRPEAAAAPAPARDAAVPSAAADHRILLIEDNLDSAATLSELLRLHGHLVETAHDAEQGMSKAREFRPDVVLCDIGLPGDMDGYAVARSMREDPRVRSAFLVALTGFGREADRQRAREAGFDAHLTKPADFAALRRLIAERRQGA